MAYTVAQVEGVITKRISAYLTIASMTSVSSPNTHLADPILWGLRMLGYTPAAIDVVTDSDLSSVPAAHLDALLDLAELRALESVNTRYTRVSGSIGPLREDWGELGTRLAELIKTKRENAAAQHGRLLEIPLTPTDKRTILMEAL